MFKLSYKHLKWVGTDILKQHHVRLIHLHRENVLRMGISSFINTAAVRGDLDHPTHSFEPVPPTKVRLPVAEFIRGCFNHLEKVRIMIRTLEGLGLPLLKLTYEDLVGYEGNEPNELMADTAKLLCRHLGVDWLPMISYTRRVNPSPLSEIVENWSELAAAVRETELVRFLEAEMGSE